MGLKKQVKLVKDLVSISSFSGQEKLAVNFLIQQTKKLNFTSVKKDKAGNFVAIRGSGKKQILLLGHIDTVFGVIPVKIVNHRLYGRGSVDAKGSLAAFIWAVHNLSVIDDKKIIIIGAVQEELPSSYGARYILGRYNPDFIIIGEPSGWSNITIGYKGILRFDYTLEKRVAHFAGKETSAAQFVVEFISELNSYLHNLKIGDQISNFPNFNQPKLEIRNINTFNNGFKQKVVAELNIRIPPEFDISKLEQFLNSSPIVIKERVEGVVAGKNNPLVRCFLKSIRYYKARPKFIKKTGTSDFNILAARYPGTPIVAYGPGDSKLDHTPNEHINVNEYLRSIDVLSRVLKEL